MALQTLIFGLMALVAGCVLPLQAAVNSELARGIASPLTATAVSFCVGAVALLAVAALTRQPLPTVATLRGLPVHVWLAGGLLGATYLCSIIYLTPKLGVAIAMSTAIAGQLLAAVVLDHYGLMGIALREATPGRLAGVVVMMAGVLMIRFL